MTWLEFLLMCCAVFFFYFILQTPALRRNSFLHLPQHFHLGPEDCLAHALSSVTSHVSIKGGGDVKLIIYVHLLPG